MFAAWPDTKAIVLNGIFAADEGFWYAAAAAALKSCADERTVVTGEWLRVSFEPPRIKTLPLLQVSQDATSGIAP